MPVVIRNIFVVVFVRNIFFVVFFIELEKSRLSSLNLMPFFSYFSERFWILSFSVFISIGLIRSHSRNFADCVWRRILEFPFFTFFFFLAWSTEYCVLFGLSFLFFSHWPLLFEDLVHFFLQFFQWWNFFDLLTKLLPLYTIFFL